jgi:hypothetical protein
MQIEFERSGGFMGLRLATSFNTTDLPEEDAEEVSKLIESSGFFGLPTLLESASPGGDQFRYRLTVSREQDEPHTHTVTMGEASAPPEIQPLLRKLTLLARSKPG